MIHALFFTFSKKSQNWAIHVLFLKKKRERWPVCIIPLWIHCSLLCFNVLVDARVFVAYVLYNVLLTYNTNLGTLNVRMVSIPCQNTVFLLLLQFASFSRIFLCVSFLCLAIRYLYYCLVIVLQYDINVSVVVTTHLKGLHDFLTEEVFWQSTVKRIIVLK